MRRPLIRASYFKTLIGDVKRLREPDRSAILDRAGDDLRAQIRQAPLVDWLPADAFARLADSIGQRLGERGAIDLFRRSMLASLSRSFLMPLKLGAIRIYGKTPVSLLRMTPRAWSLLAKDCGGCKVIEPAPGSVLVRFTELPAALRARTVMCVWAGGCDACVEEAGFQGTSTMHDEKLALGRAEILVSYHAAK